LIRENRGCERHIENKRRIRDERHTWKFQGIEIELSSDSCLETDLGVRLFFASFNRPFPKLVEDEAEDGSWELREGEWVGNGGVDCERV
jgi:hypothetical protein